MSNHSVFFPHQEIMGVTLVKIELLRHGNHLHQAPVRSPPPAHQHSAFLQAACASFQPTNSVKALKAEK